MFIGIANVLKAFLNTSVFPFCYPELVRSVSVGDGTRFVSGVRSMILQTSAVTLSVVILSLLLIKPLLGWVDRPVYGEHMDLFYWSLLAVALYAAGVAQCAIYAYRMDNRIIVSQVAGLAAFTVAAAILTRLFGVTRPHRPLCRLYDHVPNKLGRIFPPSARDGLPTMNDSSRPANSAPALHGRLIQELAAWEHEQGLFDYRLGGIPLWR